MNYDYFLIMKFLISGISILALTQFIFDVLEAKHKSDCSDFGLLSVSLFDGGICLCFPRLVGTYDMDVDHPCDLHHSLRIDYGSFIVTRQ